MKGSYVVKYEFDGKEKIRHTLFLEPKWGINLERHGTNSGRL